MTENDDLLNFFEELDENEGIDDLDGNVVEGDEQKGGDEEEEELYAFDCPGCAQSLAVGTEDLGIEMECPNCQGKILVPNLNEDSEAEFAAGSVAEASDIEDDGNRATDLFRGHFEDAKTIYGIDLMKFRYLSQQQCWESAVAAEIIKIQLESLKESVWDEALEQAHEKGSAKNQEAYLVWAEAKLLEFLRTYESIHEFSTKLDSILETNTVTTVLKLKGVIAEISTSLKQLHEEIYAKPLPVDKGIQSGILQSVTTIISLHPTKSGGPLEEDPLVLLNGAMKEWIPPCVQKFNDIIDRLAEHSLEDRANGGIEFQLSFVPPSLNRFLKLIGELEQRTQKTKPVYRELVPDAEPE